MPEQPIRLLEDWVGEDERVKALRGCSMLAQGYFDLSQQQLNLVITWPDGQPICSDGAGEIMAPGRPRSPYQLYQVRSSDHIYSTI
jgi:hypothetical protein